MHVMGDIFTGIRKLRKSTPTVANAIDGVTKDLPNQLYNSVDYKDTLSTLYNSINEKISDASIDDAMLSQFCMNNLHLYSGFT